MTKNNSEYNNDLKSLVEELRIELSDYIKKRARLFKLDAFEKGGIALSRIGYGLIVIVISCGILFFFLFGLAFFLGDLLNNNAAGFGLLLVFCILALLLVMLNAKKIKRALLLKFVEIMRKIDANETE